MARTNDPNSATSQFFINVVDNPWLDYPGRDGYGYTVFGHVVDGMDVVDAIRTVPTSDAGMFQNVPVKPVVIERADLIQAKTAK
jgi:cyclophilin family peptidyl-prolyl cis-trans isomerase